jgi:hypothetical protein
MRGWLRAREIGKGWSATSAPSSSYALGFLLIWHRLDQTTIASFFGDAEIPLGGNIEALALQMSSARAGSDNRLPVQDNRTVVE